MPNVTPGGRLTKVAGEYVAPILELRRQSAAPDRPT